MNLGIKLNRDMTVEDFFVQNPKFIKPIIAGSVLGVLKAVGEEPEEFADTVDDIVTDMLTKPAVSIFVGEGNGN